MDILSNLRYAKGAVKKRKRVGRGEGSGHGGTATRGMNGQKSRSGAKHRAWFEGGQMPLQRRVPKKGFNHIFKIHYQAINLDRLQKLADENRFEDNIVNPATLYKAGVINKAEPYKILGNGELTAKLTIEAYGFSASAKEKIEKAGGTIKEIKA